MLEWMEQSAAPGTPFEHRAMRDHASDLASQHNTQDPLDSSHFAITSLYRYGCADDLCYHRHNIRIPPSIFHN